MLAQFYYSEQTPPSAIMSDIRMALVGESNLSVFSDYIDKNKSHLNQTVKGSWFHLSSSSLTEDILGEADCTLLENSSQTLRQLIQGTTSYKHLKIQMLSNGTKAMLVANIGQGSASGDLIDFANPCFNVSRFKPENMVSVSDSGTSATLVKPVKLTIYSSPSATVICLAENTFKELFQFAVLNIADNFKDADAGTYMPVLHMPANNPPSWGEPADQPLMSFSPFSMDSSAYNGTTEDYGYITALPTVVNLSTDYKDSELLCSYKRRASNFSNTGKFYDTFNFGVCKFKVRSTKISPPFRHFDDGYLAMPYSPVDTGVLLCNYYSFGPSGSFYRVSGVPYCKIGCLMLRVS